MNFFIIDFNKTATDKMGLRSVIFGDRNYLAECSRDDAFSLLWLVATHHSMSLTTSCLTIGKYGSIVAVKHAVYKRKCTLFIYKGLRAICSEYIVERETFGLLFMIFFYEVYLIILRVHLYHTYTPLILYQLPLSIYLRFIGRTRTITFTASAIYKLISNFNKTNNLHSHLHT